MNTKTDKFFISEAEFYDMKMAHNGEPVKAEGSESGTLAERAKRMTETLRNLRIDAVSGITAIVKEKDFTFEDDDFADYNVIDEFTGTIEQKKFTKVVNGNNGIEFHTDTDEVYFFCNFDTDSLVDIASDMMTLMA